METDYIVQYLGPIGSYSYEVALQFQNQFLQEKKVKLQPMLNITKIFQQPTTIKTNTITYCVVPLENSTSGDVYETYKNLYEHNIELITAEILDIEHVLIGCQDAEIGSIKKVYSHPQALLQVTEFTTEYNWETTPYFSTADAVNLISEQQDKTIGAIASKTSTAFFDNVTILKEKISNNESNFTRFFIYKQLPEKQQYHYFSFNYETNKAEQNWFLLVEFNEDKSGQLNQLLALIADKKINLNNIKSRPVEGERFKYFFILEAKFNLPWTYEEHQIFFDEIKQQTKTLKYYVY